MFRTITTVFRIFMGMIAGIMMRVSYRILENDMKFDLKYNKDQLWTWQFRRTEILLGMYRDVLENYGVFTREYIEDASKG